MNTSTAKASVELLKESVRKLKSIDWYEVLDCEQVSNFNEMLMDIEECLNEIDMATSNLDEYFE